ncbi:hypothetical protein AB0L63_23100 [Nocardia sp. NPDC051990]|uniref:hypothetical protein n=1 Tax=Nocardia sp. NPDC051990 TaxID=3155285 RepID=UPI00343CE056
MLLLTGTVGLHGRDPGAQRRARRGTGGDQALVVGAQEFTRLAAAGLILLLIVMLPANIRAARADIGIKTMPLPRRTVVQFIFLGAATLVLLG